MHFVIFVSVFVCSFCFVLSDIVSGVKILTVASFTHGEKGRRVVGVVGGGGQSFILFYLCLSSGFFVSFLRFLLLIFSLLILVRLLLVH